MQWGRLEYFVPAEGLTWAGVFGTLEKSRHTLPIEDYAVTQTTLERVSHIFFVIFFHSTGRSGSIPVWLVRCDL